MEGGGRGLRETAVAAKQRSVRVLVRWRADKTGDRDGHAEPPTIAVMKGLGFGRRGARPARVIACAASVQYARGCGRGRVAAEIASGRCAHTWCGWPSDGADDPTAFNRKKPRVWRMRARGVRIGGACALVCICASLSASCQSFFKPHPSRSVAATRVLKRRPSRSRYVAGAPEMLIAEKNPSFLAGIADEHAANCSKSCGHHPSSPVLILS